MLFMGSLFFYAWGEPVYVFILLISCLLNYFMGLAIDTEEQTIKRKSVFVFSVIFNIAILILFKYIGKFIEIVNINLSWDKSYFDFGIPLGISFYTLNALSYITDIYRKKVKAQKNFINFGTYITMLSKLLAGPVVSYNKMEKQLMSRRETIEGFSSGIVCFVVGLAKKVILADNLFVLWESIKLTPTAELTTVLAWLGIISFALYIYFDFSGYSDMAIGLLKMFGFEFGKNFDYPYTSRSISEFWSKWNISLYGWFKEYVYLPLERKEKKPFKTGINILTVWILVGLWHNFTLNFLLFGLYFALFCIIEKSISEKNLKKIPDIFRVFYTIIFVLIGWVFFATPDLTSSIEFFKAMFGFSSAGAFSSRFIYDVLSNGMLLIASVFASLPYASKTGKILSNDNPAHAIVPIALLFVLSLVYIVGSTTIPFAYFNF
ncbi:MAG: MBOAT family protein [Clostridia bacterium]|nr:MBOAT family protein [Clostridia bacterium]